MTRYVLTEDGLPGQIAVAGEDILAAPVTLEERGTRLAGTPLRIISKKRHEADWSSTFTASGARMTVTSHIEYEGLIRYTLAIEPSGAGQVGPLRIVIPIKRSAATHYLYNLAGQTGARADLVPGQDGLALSSRLPRFWHEQGKARQAKPDSPARELKFSEFQAYAFFTQLGLCNLDRGLYWFADNANGWQLSSRICAQEVFRKGETTEIRLNLIAEPGTLDGKRTIVFGLLPHPARPMPEKWRRFDRADLQKEPLYCSISNAFQPWPMEPRTHGMQVFPAPDPRKPDDGPSYEYAQRCAKSFSDSYPHGFRSIYLSKYWFSCRAGAYDHWEWRSGEGMRASLSQSFVDYLVWEMDQWIGKDIYTAIYLDECYEAPNGNVESGDATLLPDGTVLPGANLWGFRDLMKRWRHLFHVYRKPPMIVGHLTGSFMYPGIVFCDAFLDGEGSPTITASGGSFIQHTSRHRLEVINSQHWGVAPFYMVSIWEGGLGKGKGWNPHTRWSWRMARSAMARLLPFENGTMYTDQGSQVYRAVASDLARFGADEDDVAFYPYWRNADSFSLSAGPQSRYNPVPDTKDVIVCFYKRESRILVIVSNWDTRNKDVLIALNKAKLGLPDTFTVRDWDSSLQPDPKSLDIYSSEEMKKTLAGVKLDVSLTERPAESEAPREGGADDEETAVEDELREGGKETRESEESRIRIDPHGRIFVRLRQQDFRMFVVNPPPEEAASPESPQSQPTRLRDTEEP
jgi:hypothetical protein